MTDDMSSRLSAMQKMPKPFKKYTTCYLHIGTEKTGTTSIQSFLARNRQRLLAKGILYPDTFCGNRANHFQLAVYGQNDDKLDDLRRELGLVSPKQVKMHRQKLRARFAVESEEAAGAKILLLSNEHCHSRLVTVREIRRVYDLLSPWCDKILIIVYLRPQHELALSRYSTHVKLGGSATNPFPDIDSSANFFNYENLLSRWGEVFGEENLMPKIFSRAELKAGNVLDDFLDLIKVSLDGMENVDVQNESLSPKGLLFMEHVNRLLPRFVNGKVNPERGNIGKLAGELFPGKGPLVNRGDAMRFYGMFEASNKNVQERFFPERQNLFNVDFSIYPVDGVVSTISIDEVFEMFINLWRHR